MTGTLNGNDLQVEVKYQGPELTDDMTIDVSLSGRKNGLMGPATGNRVTLYAGTTSATLNFGGLKPDIYTLSATVDGVSVTVSTPTIEVADSILTVTTTNPDIVKSEECRDYSDARQGADQGCRGYNWRHSPHRPHQRNLQVGYLYHR